MNEGEHKTNLQIQKKLSFFKDVIQKTVMRLSKNKKVEILDSSELNASMSMIHGISKLINEFENSVETKMKEKDYLIEKLQQMNDELSFIFKKYGPESIDDLLTICFGTTSTFLNTEEEICVYDILKKYFHPTQYNVISIKKENDNDDVNMQCSDISIHVKTFHIKVHGIKVFIYNKELNKHLLVYGILDDVIVSMLNNPFLNTTIRDNKTQNPQIIL
jgi:hypothetical protein